MPRLPDKPLTEEEKFRLQEQQEEELTCLQRRYALLEKDRHLFTAGWQLGRLNRILSIFRREHNNILTDLGVANAPTKRRQNAQNFEKLSEVLEEHDFYVEGLKQERQYLQEMEGQIKLEEVDVVKLRTMQLTDRAQEDRICVAVKTIDTLMNKLDVQNKKFGILCAKNRELKLEIDRTLWEREIFMKIWNKLIKKLVLGKQFMTDLIEQATIAYDQREEWVSKLQALRMKAHYDFILHKEEMRELKRKQDHQNKMRDFFNIKGQKRMMKDLMEKERVKRAEHKERMSEQLTLYQKYMQEIFDFTKEDRVQDIAQKYYQQESENFSLFLQVNNLIQEMERMNDDLSDFRNQIDEEKSLEDKRSQVRRNNLTQFQSERDSLNQEVEDTKKEIGRVEVYIKDMLTKIENLFKTCKCNADPIYKLLGDNAHINVYNFQIYIEMIENVASPALVKVYHEEKLACEKKKITGDQRVIYDDNTKGELSALHKSVPSDPCPLCIGHEFMSDVIDSVQHVLSREEAKEILAKRLLTPDYLDHIHNVSACFLPESREIIQRRYM